MSDVLEFAQLFPAFFALVVVALVFLGLLLVGMCGAIRSLQRQVDRLHDQVRS